MVPPVAVASGLAAATVALHVRDPHVQGSWGLCPLAMAGVSCPGCGGLRAVNDLTHLRLGDAVSSNLLLVASIPLVLLALGLWTRGRWRGRPWQLSDRALRAVSVAVVGLLVVFAVVRNTPAGAWLAP